MLQLYGASIGLGFAGLVEIHTNHDGAAVARGYRSAMLFGVGLAVVATIVSLAFIRMPKEAREGWQGEDVGEGTSNDNQKSEVPV